MKRNSIAVLFLMGTACAFADSESAFTSHVARCDQLYQLTDRNQAVEPGVVVGASGDVPAHCRVRGVIDGTIRFEVSMPIQGWKGRMMFLAHGSNSGRIGNTKDLMKEGFAGATTNSGHDYGPVSSEFVTNHNALINFGFRAVHFSTVVAKRIIAEFYGRPVDHSYIQGCSGGGRSALMEALRFPDDYDGIIAGAPALGWINSIMPWGVAASRMQKKHPLTAESLVLLAKNSKQRCDTLDGLEDGVISYPQACTLEALKLDNLQCKQGQEHGCLSEGQIETASFLYTGLKNDAGEVAYNGIYPGDEDQGDWMVWVTGVPGVPVAAPGNPDTVYETSAHIIGELYHEDPTFNIEEFDPINDQAELARIAVPVELPAPDFTPFHESEGKLIIYQGWQDVPLRSRDTIDFLTDAAKLSGGQKVMDQFSRTYMVPNMLHCMGGTGGWVADYITPMVEWVENGRAPESIVGTNPGISNWLEATYIWSDEGVDWYGRFMKAGEEKDPSTKSTRLLCPYPQVARYNGSGDIKDAANYSCGLK